MCLYGVVGVKEGCNLTPFLLLLGLSLCVSRTCTHTRTAAILGASPSAPEEKAKAKRTLYPRVSDAFSFFSISLTFFPFRWLNILNPAKLPGVNKCSCSPISHCFHLHQAKDWRLQSEVCWIRSSWDCVWSLYAFSVFCVCTEWLTLICHSNLLNVHSWIQIQIVVFVDIISQSIT